MTRLFVRLVGDRAIVSVQNPISLGPRSEPQPDIALLRPRADLYRTAHPRPDEVLLVVEIADSSLDYDRDEKGPAYANAGIADYWIVDVKKRLIEARSEPRPDGYRQTRLLYPGDVVPVPGLPDLTVAISDLLGAP